MKTSQVILIAIIAILIHACETQVNKPADFKVASISNIGDFVYEGDRLVRLGDENLEYDLSGNLSSSRIFIATDTVVEFDPLWGGQYDSTYHYQLEKYSYTWINQSTLIRVTDTFIYKDVQGGLIFPQDIERYNSDTVFYWYNDLGYIDSLVNYSECPNIRYWSPYGPEYGDSSLNKERISYAYTYDEGANIHLVKIYNNGGLISTKAYQYDSQANPYNRIFKMAGGLTLKTEGRNFSPNNPVSYRSGYMINDGNPIYSDYTIHYDYNRNGMPVAIYFLSDTVRISYK